MDKVSIVVDVASVHRSLAMIAAGRGTAARWCVVGVPLGVTNICIHVEDVASGGFASFEGVCDSQGHWNFAVEAIPFSVVKDYRYHITGIDENGSMAWFGSGVFRLLPSFLPAGSAPVVHEDGILVYNRSTGKYHKLQFENDEDGNPVPIWTTEGVER